MTSLNVHRFSFMRHNDLFQPPLFPLFMTLDFYYIALSHAHYVGS